MRALNFFQNMDKTIAKIVLILSFSLMLYAIVSSSYIYILFSLLLLLSSLYWLLFGISYQVKNEINLSSPKFFGVLNILFFLLVTFSIIIIYNRQFINIRPTLYFILISMMSSIVSINILRLDIYKHRFLVLLQIFIIGFSLVLSQSSIYSTVIGVDPWYHQALTTQIIDMGHIPTDSAYSLLPTFHILIGSSMAILNIDYKVSSIISVGLVKIILDTLIIYLLGSKFFDHRVGLFAALLVDVSNYYLNMNFWIIPNTLGFIFVIISVYLMLRFYSNKTIISNSLIIFFLFTLVITHTISAICMATILLITAISDIFYHKFIDKQIKRKSSTQLLVLILLTLMLTWWSYASNSIVFLKDMISWGFNIDFLYRNSNKDLIEIISQTYQSQIPFQERLFYYLGLFISSALSIIGYLYMLSKKSNFLAFSFACSGIAIFIIPFMSLFLGLSLIESRWFALAQTLSAIPLAISFFALFSRTKQNRMRYSIIAISVFLFTFIMITSPIANIDNPMYSTSTSIRYAYTEGEINAASYAVSLNNSNISSDYLFSTNANSVLREYFNMNSSRIVSLDYSLIYGNFSHNGALILIRDELIDKPFIVSGVPYKINDSLEATYYGENINRIYQNNDVQIFI